MVLTCNYAAHEVHHTNLADYFFIRHAFTAFLSRSLAWSLLTWYEHKACFIIGCRYPLACCRMPWIWIWIWGTEWIQNANGWGTLALVVCLYSLWILITKNEGSLEPRAWLDMWNSDCNKLSYILSLNMQKQANCSCYNYFHSNTHTLGN